MTASTGKWRKPSRIEWLREEENYRRGDTQAVIAARLGVRIESVSRHMTKMNVKGGEKIDTVRAEIEMQVTRKKREFEQKKESRKIVAKEQTIAITQALLSLFAEDVKNVKDRKGSSAEIGMHGKALKEALGGVTASWDLLSKVLNIRPEDDNHETLPELRVVGMSEEEEEALRNAKALGTDDDEDGEGDLVEEKEVPEPAPEHPEVIGDDAA